MFDVWMAPWTADDDAYRAKRACQFARAAADLAAKLLAVSNYKHKSWYVHMICFVVPQQIFKYGNVWRFSQQQVSSRGAHDSSASAVQPCAGGKPFTDGPRTTIQHTVRNRARGDEKLRGVFWIDLFCSKDLAFET